MTLNVFTKTRCYLIKKIRIVNNIGVIIMVRMMRLNIEELETLSPPKKPYLLLEI